MSINTLILFHYNDHHHLQLDDDATMWKFKSLFTVRFVCTLMYIVDTKVMAMTTELIMNYCSVDGF